MKLAIATDHAGFDFKESLRKILEHSGHEVSDLGTHSPESCDYPDFALKVGEAVASGKAERGILICGAGHGMAIAANKVPGVRAATAYDDYSARLSREHNDANVLVLPARVIALTRGVELAKIFLETPFQGGRHAARLAKITEIEKKYSKGIS
jgi:RpiB/LacA/LacB family sugar-phosphate isomerase